MTKRWINLAPCDPSAGITLMEVALLVGVLATMLCLRVHRSATQEVIARDGVVYVQMAREWSADPAGVIARYDYHVAIPRR